MKINVSVPWTATYYMPLNGVHAIYQPLINLHPSTVNIYALDFLKVQKQLINDKNFLKKFEKKSQFHQSKLHLLLGQNSPKYLEYYTNASALQNELISGDLEFHHTAAFPSMTKPFILHCEHFLPSFFPFAHQGQQKLKILNDIKPYYKKLYEHELCVGIFSHLEETITGFSKFFDSSIIDEKLNLTKVGLISETSQSISKSTENNGLTFLFINSGNQHSEGFFQRGGDIVLRFWKKYIEQGNSGILILRCTIPSDERLMLREIDILFFRGEINKTIFIDNQFITQTEMQNLFDKSDIFLLPSLCLHSASIMLALSSGTIPVVSDTVGTDLYVKDGYNGIVLKGIKSAIWKNSDEYKIMYDSAQISSGIATTQVNQLLERINSIVKEDKFEPMQKNTLMSFQSGFDPQQYSDHFWGEVAKIVNKKHSLFEKNQTAVSSSTLYLDKKDFLNFNEFPPQPVKIVDTGKYEILMQGGLFMMKNHHIKGKPNLKDLDIISVHLAGNQNDLVLDSSINFPDNEFYERCKGHTYNFDETNLGRKKIVLQDIKLYYKYLQYKFLGNIEEDVQLIEELKDYNLIRFFNFYIYYPQVLGAFNPKVSDKRIKRFYSKTTWTLMNNKQSIIVRLIKRSVKNIPFLYNLLKRGYHRLISLHKFSMYLKNFIKFNYLGVGKEEIELVHVLESENIIRYFHLYFVWPKVFNEFNYKLALEKKAKRSIFLHRIKK